MDNITHNHEPCGFMFYVVSSFDEFKFKPKFYRGEYAIEIFLRELLAVKDQIMKILKINKSKVLTDEYKIMYKNSTHCHIYVKNLCLILQEKL